MKQTSARLLRLLALLQTRREWSGRDLADRLGVSTRTVRRDIDKLRALDYPVHASKGIDGGYRLDAGTRLPPLQLDDEEAVAITIALRTATTSGVTGIGETALRALVKLEQLLPARLRHRVELLRPAAVSAPSTRPTVDAQVLTTLATACRDRHRLRFDYRGHDGRTSRRDTEPHELVTWGPRWYLVAWDRDRADWRTFRADRISPIIPTGPRFEPRPIPGGDAASHVSSNVARMWPSRAIIRLHVPANSTVARDAAGYGTVTAVDEHSCLLDIGADNPRALVFLLAAIDTDFHIEDGAELAAHLRAITDRFRAALA
ncbi:transcriptional regulator [Nocardia sp. NBC_00565]|uniref:helix-turn-helix transcriptional regulator n=1 Tax=Nocardia sp. NBC_00565 TaxID=2975993 RepID=UPI002E815705|nr:transcriptional regulator [Nocardia sp. NBC_00565]WUC05401.1 transcriptional regulator [Nocardia sp. NBC_00565]